MRKTYRDIAAELSLHVKTVYRVLNNEPNVLPATRQRVIAALNRTVSSTPHGSARRGS